MQGLASYTLMKHDYGNKPRLQNWINFRIEESEAREEGIPVGITNRIGGNARINKRLN